MSNRESFLFLCLLISFSVVTFGCQKNNPSTAAVQVTSSFAADKPFGDSPVKVKFTNASINGSSYLWDFGDHTTSTDKDPVHTFTNPANSSTTSFTVTLTSIATDHSMSVTSKYLNENVLVVVNTRNQIIDYPYQGAWFPPRGPIF